VEKVEKVGCWMPGSNYAAAISQAVVEWNFNLYLIETLFPGRRSIIYGKSHEPMNRGFNYRGVARENLIDTARFAPD
jgi:hypothetical protein